MKHYHLTIISKNKKSIKDLLAFFNITTLHFKTIKKYFKKNKKRKFFTILKSPHVNKTAQEQFEYKIYSSKLIIYSPLSFKSLIFLKKIKNNLFPDTKIKLKLIINSRLSEKTQMQIFDPTNFKLNIFNIVCNKNKKLKETKQYHTQKFIKSQKKTFKQIKNVLKILDIYGEFIKKYVQIAQLVEQRTENPCVGSSNLPLDNTKNEKLSMEYVC